MNDDIEPAESALWFRRVEKIARDELPGIENTLRHAAHLLQIAPRRLQGKVGLAVGENTFEALLECGDFDTAARYLVAQPTALTIQSAGKGGISATIACSVLERNVQGTGETIAAAVIQAWATCLLALRSRFGADLAGLVDEPASDELKGPRPNLP